MGLQKEEEQQETAYAPLPPTTTREKEKNKDRGGEKKEEEILLCTEAGLRGLIRSRLPTAESPPSYVRLWLAGYFTYRGVEARRADGFLWSGAELQALARADLVDAFRAKLVRTDADARGAGGDGMMTTKATKWGEGRRQGPGARGGDKNGGRGAAGVSTYGGSVVTEAEVEMLAADVFEFVQSAKPFWTRMLARAGRLTSLQATMWERLDAFLILVAHLGILCLVLASLSGIWDRKGLDEAIAALLQRPRAWVGQFGESREWLGQLVGAWGRKFMMRRI